jgi:hypothetical protein
MADLEIQGAEEFAAVAKALKQAGEKDLQKELRVAIQRAAEPMVDAVREHIEQYLPDRYAAVLAPALKTGQSWRTGGSVTGLVLTGYAKGRSKRRYVKAINAGILRHPVWGNRSAWVAQQVRPGFWDEPMANAAEKPTEEIQQALGDVAGKLARKY